MADSSENCCDSCIAFCCPCCKQSNEKYSEVKYSSPAGVQNDPAEYKMPIKKMTYEFSQPPAEFPVHPQMTGDSRGSRVGGADVVATQPRLLPPKISTPRSSRESSPIDPSVPSTFPTIQYSLYYDMQRNILAVHLQQIFNLPIRRKTKNLDSVVTLYLTPHKEEVFESKVVQKSLNPLFSQQFEFTGQPGLELTKKQVLIFKIFEHGKSGRGELLGVVPVKLEEADLFGETARMRIQESSTEFTKLESVGDILLSLTFLPETDTLNGLLLKASNLMQQDITGTADPYVKICLYHKGKNIQKWKSSTKKNTLSPVFNELFHFSMYNLDTSEMHLDVIMMDYDRFSRDDVVGMVQIGADIPDGRGRTHWEEVMSGCNEPISRWHQILPK